VSVGSVLGFALVFATVAWTLSAIGGIILTKLRARLVRVGPMAERRAAEALAIVPLVLAAAAVATLVAQSAIGADHCQAHSHHAHLCLAHGTGWLDRMWVVVTLAGVGAVVAAGVLFLVTACPRGLPDLLRLRTAGPRPG